MGDAHVEGARHACSQPHLGDVDAAVALESSVGDESAGEQDGGSLPMTGAVGAMGLTPPGRCRVEGYAKCSGQGFAWRRGRAVALSGLTAMRHRYTPGGGGVCCRG